MTVVTIHAAKTNLSKLIVRALSGEVIVICKGKTPVARLTAIQPSPVKRRFGAYKGEFTVPDGFFAPLPEAELDAWEGGSTDGDPLGHPRSAVVEERQSPTIGKSPRGDRKRKR